MPMNVGAEIELAGHDAMSAPVPRQERHLAAFQIAQNVCVRRLPKRRVNHHFFNVRKPGDVVQTTTADNANFCS